MSCSMPGFPVLHHLLEFAQVHVHCISDAIQTSQPLTPSSPSALSLSQHQGLCQWIICSHPMTKIPELQLQHQSFEWVFSVDFPKDWLVWSPCCPRDSQESSPAPQFKSINSLAFCLLYVPALTAVRDHWEDYSLTIWTFVVRVVSQLFNTLSRFVIGFLPKNNCLLISWLQSPSAVILGPKKRKSVTTSTFSPSICHEVMGPNAMILVFLIFSFKHTYTLFQTLLQII